MGKWICQECGSDKRHEIETEHSEETGIAEYACDSCGGYEFKEVQNDEGVK